MKFPQSKRALTLGALAAAFVAYGATHLSGCAGVNFPPVDVDLDVVQDVQVSIAIGTGSEDIPLDEMCTLFSADELITMVRAAAGSEIPNFVSITSVELLATDIIATDDTSFDPFTMATLDVTVDDGSGDTVLLGMAEDNGGLGEAFSLTLDNPVDVLNRLDADECGSATLHVDGGEFELDRDITFDVVVTLRVHTEVSAP